jgi:predicted small secreted protein
MKKLIIIAVLAVLLQGCGVVKGVGQAVGFACQGVGAIGKGINADLTAASDGHSDQYYSNRKK